MITPELITYMRGEFAKGKTREEIHQALMAAGGWSEADLNEAFRTVIPIQGFEQNSFTAPNTSFAKSSSALRKILLTVFILGAIGAVIYFYRVPVLSWWNSMVNLSNKTNNNVDNTIIPAPEIPVVPDENVVVSNTNTAKDCGVGTTPNLKNPLTYENDAVLSCLGNSAVRCENAQATLKDSLFPTIFQIVKNGDTCNFQLSYAGDSTLVDITGVYLAGQYMTCPLSIVKAVDESKKIPSFNAPNMEDLGKYASQIYFYGTLGLFMENNVDLNKIQSLGCSGSYINSVIASYKKAQTKN